MAWIQSHLISVVAPLALGAALVALAKSLPSMLEKKAEAALDKLFAEGDAADDAWLVATCKWAEAKYGAGSGELKAKAVVDKITALLPVQYRLFMTDGVRAKAVALFQKSFDALEASVLKEIKGHEQTPAA